MDYQWIITIITVCVSSGLIQFLIQRKDQKNDKIKKLEAKLDKGLEEREETGKSRYLEHRESIQELQKAILQLSQDSKSRAELERAMADSLMAITHDKLVYLGKKYQERGCITLAEKNNLKLLYKPYHDGLGGNSDGETYYNYCMNELPVVIEEVASAKDQERAAYDQNKEKEEKTQCIG